MTNLRHAAQQALEALEIGYDSAKEEADQFHSAMAGYKPQRHAQMDADVQTIAKAITALKQALAEPEPIEDVVMYGSAWSKDGKRIDPMSVYKEPEQEPVCDKDPRGCWNVRCQLGKVCKNTAPTPRKPLTDEEIALIVGECAASAHRHNDFSFARAVIAAYQKKQGEQT